MNILEALDAEINRVRKEEEAWKRAQPEYALPEILWACQNNCTIARKGWKHKWGVWWHTTKKRYYTNGSFHFIKPEDVNATDWYILWSGNK